MHASATVCLQNCAISEWCFGIPNGPNGLILTGRNCRCTHGKRTLSHVFYLVVSNIFYVHPYLGKISILTYFFQRVETTTLYCFKCLKDQDPTKYENDIQVFLLKSWWDQENPTVERMGQGCKRNKSPRHTSFFGDKKHTSKLLTRVCSQLYLPSSPKSDSSIFSTRLSLVGFFLGKNHAILIFSPQKKRGGKKVTGILQVLKPTQ